MSVIDYMFDYVLPSIRGRCAGVKGVVSLSHGHWIPAFAGMTGARDDGGHVGMTPGRGLAVKSE